MKRIALHLSVLVVLMSIAAAPYPAPSMQGDDPNPPAETVKLIFIHHSTGENWLADDNGGLGLALGQNNYFVSDTNYGWGSNAIGDRTDISNWLEWFRSADTETIMQAVYNENAQNSPYTRTLSDPGGENQIVMFKSCFPNSNLEGNPDDPPTPGSDLTVGNAKYVYNELLKYFITRPDKLFVVVTAPPISDPALAANARAFNQWLFSEWLQQNDYPYNNVAVFDFYNVLTGAENHHRYTNGQIEHIFTPGTNTSFYPSDDDHPSHAGDQKATSEFIPMLNIFYNRWKANAPAQPLQAGDDTEPAAPPAPDVEAAQPPSAVGGQGIIDDYESGPPAGTQGWEAFWDEATSTRITCSPDAGTVHGGAKALQVDFAVAATSWATCALTFDAPQDWSSQQGISFFFRAAKAGLVFDVDIYSGASDNKETYLYRVEAPPKSVGDWIPVNIAWSDFHRADWEENAGAPFEKSAQVSGLAIGINNDADSTNTNTIWVDDLYLPGAENAADVTSPSPVPATSIAQPAAGAEAQGATEAPKQRTCGGAFIPPVAALALGLWWKTRRGY